MNLQRFLVFVVCLGLAVVNAVGAVASSAQPPLVAMRETVLPLPEFVDPFSTAPSTNQGAGNASAAPLQNFAAIAAGSYHARAVTTGDGVHSALPFRVFFPGVSTGVQSTAPTNTPTASATPTATPTGPTPTATPSLSPIPMQMVPVSAGSFRMGCDPSNYEFPPCSATPVPVSTGAYRIDQTEVTNGQYAGCVATGQCTPPTRDYLGTRRPYYGNPLYINYPVVNVTWAQADVFCRWAGKRLPTQAEWEKAARGSSDTRNFPWGNAAPSCSLANFRPALSGPNNGYCVGSTSAAGSYPAGASPYGVLDMAGNVSEWVSDGHRGGSWEGPNIDQEIWPIRPATAPEWSSTTIGIRCVADN